VTSRDQVLRRTRGVRARGRVRDARVQGGQRLLHNTFCEAVVLMYDNTPKFKSNRLRAEALGAIRTWAAI